MTATQLITQALRDLSELRPGASASSTDVMNEALVQLNQMIDEWAFERLFVYKTDKTTLASFADLGTDYALAAGYAKALRKNLAVALAPMMKIYFKKESALDEGLMSEASGLKAALRGVGVA